MRRIHFERIFVHSFAFQYASSAVLKISACFSRLKVEKFHLMKSADYYDISVSIFGSACIGCGFFFRRLHENVSIHAIHFSNGLYDIGFCDDSLFFGFCKMFV